MKSAILSFINSGWQWGILTNLGGNSHKIPTQIEETENDQPDVKGEGEQATIMTTVGKRIGLAVKYETLRGVAPILHQSLAPSAAWRKNLALAGTLRTLMNLGEKAGQGKAGIYHPGFYFQGEEKVKRYETYLQLFLKESDDNKIENPELEFNVG